MNRTSAIAALAVAALAGSAHAGVVESFFMFDHPDGNAAPAFYGLRADNLFGEGNINTFSLDHFGDSILTVHDNGGDLSIHMTGTIFGGEDGGAAPVNPEAYTFEFWYTEGVEAFDGGWRVVGTDDANGGSITRVSDNATFEFSTKADGSGVSFIFAPDGHRLPGDDDWAGRGWVMSDENPRGQYTQDWLFTGEVVPAPGTLALALGGGLLTMPRRRRK